jgi:hypothetical protein
MVSIPTDPLYSAKLRIERADKLIDKFVAEIERFFSENPPEIVAELNAEGTHVSHKIKMRERFPIGWRILATEIVEHLRAALDHATFSTFFLSTHRLDSNYASFPFGKTGADLDRSVRGRCKDCPKEIQALLRSFNAYQGGNDLLYTLNNLANDCKHGLVTFIVGGVIDSEISSFAVAGGVQFANPLVWDTQKNEIVYATVLKGVDFQHQGKLSAVVAIPETEHLPAFSATGVLEAIGIEVVRVVDAIEAECLRIGLIKAM